MNNGFIVIWRKFKDTSFYKDSYAVHLALHLLMEVNHETKKFVFNGREIEIQRGECICGRKSLAYETGINTSTIWRRLHLLQSIGFLNIKANNKFSIITILNYNTYQNIKLKKEQHSEQQLNNQRTTTEQQLNNQRTQTTIQQCNNDNNETMKQVIDDLNLVLGTSYKPTTKQTQDLIKARLNDSFTLEDFKVVHRKMLRAWGADDKMVKFLRPITLYGNKFEGYLNQKTVTTKLTPEGVKAYLVGQAWLQQEEIIDVR